MEEQKATDAGPEAPAKRRGRPPGSKRKATDRELIEQLAARIDALQKAEIDRIDTSKIGLAPQIADAPPGTILVAGKDSRTGDPYLFKKTWTHGDMTRIYPEVTFTPQYTVPVTVQRVTVQMVAGMEWTGPKVFNKRRWDIPADRRLTRRISRGPQGKPAMLKPSRSSMTPGR